MPILTIVAPENRPGNIDFNKIWNRAKDCDVAAVILEVNNTTLCLDSQHALTAKEVIDCCEQGCVIWHADGFYRPVYWKENSGVVTVVCLDNSGTSGALAAKVFNSYQTS